MKKILGLYINEKLSATLLDASGQIYWRNSYKLGKGQDLSSIIFILNKDLEEIGHQIDRIHVSVDDTEVIYKEFNSEELKQDPEKWIIDSIKEQLIADSTKWEYDIFQISSKNKNIYMFIASKLESLAKVLEPLYQNNLAVNSIEPATFSFIRWLNEKTYKEFRTILILDDNNSKLVFEALGVPINVIELPIGLIDTLRNIFNKKEGIVQKFDKEINTKKIISKISQDQRYIFHQFEESFKEFELFIKANFDINIEEVLVYSPKLNAKFLSTIWSNYKFINLPTKLSLDDIISKGSALKDSDEVRDENEINFIDEKLENLIKQDIDAIETAEKMRKAERDHLIKLYSENWEVESKQSKDQNWDFILKFSKASKLLLGLVVTVIFSIVSFHIYELWSINNNVEQRKEEAELSREFFNFSYNISTVSNESESEGLIARYTDTTVNYEREFELNGNVLTQERYQGAYEQAVEDLYSGEDLRGELDVAGSEFIIPEPINYIESFSTADISIGDSADNFTVLIRARIEFAVVDKVSLDSTMIDQMRDRGIEEVGEYELDFVLFELSDYSEITGQAIFKIISEAKER